MKTELSSLELHYLIKEIQPLVGGKVEQIYQIGKEELILQLHIPSQGKRILRCILGKMMYLASGKGEVPEKPHGFCLFLRRKLKNARLRSLTQLGFERIVEFLLETKEAKFRLIIELFSNGNIILTDENNKIFSALENRDWKDRSIRPGKTYIFPEKEFNFLTLTDKELRKLLHKSDKENVVKSLAIELGLGGTYAEELCIEAKIDKNLKPAQLSDKELAALHAAILSLRDKEISPAIVKLAEGKIKDIVPFELKYYKDMEHDSAPDFNSALDSVLTTKIEKKDLDTAEKAAKTKLDKIEEVIKQQTYRIDGLEKSEKENQRKGEVIYENYPIIERVLNEIKEDRKTLSWKELKEKYKGHTIIKAIDAKTGELTLDI